MSAERKVALVTGGAKRVGRAIVERLAEAGYAVAFTYLSSEREAFELAHRVNGLAIRADLMAPFSVLREIDPLFESFAERLDVLVNNASRFEPNSLQDVDVDQSRRMMAIHFESPLLLCQSFAPMLRRTKGHIINMLDLLAERPWPQYLAYCASKAALANLTLSLARELAPDVTVNGISPGVVAWPEGYPDEEKAKYLKRVPLQRPGTPQDVADLVHFLATAAPYLTGQILRLDGGRSIT